LLRGWFIIGSGLKVILLPLRTPLDEMPDFLCSRSLGALPLNQMRLKVINYKLLMSFASAWRWPGAKISLFQCFLKWQSSAAGSLMVASRPELRLFIWQSSAIFLAGSLPPNFDVLLPTSQPESGPYQ